MIQAQDSTVIQIDVDGLVNDDLMTNQLCGVRLFFSHDQIGNIRMVLTSPSGQQVTLIGPGTVNSGLTPLVDWNIQLIPCGDPASPDVGFAEMWDNDQPWASFNTYDGFYYPNNGCLEDFDMGSANGTWTLTIENLGALEGELEFFELIFCDPQGSDCTPCYLFAGDLATDFYTTCQQDIQLRGLDNLLAPDFIIDSPSQDYTFVLSEQDDILDFSLTMSESDTLPPGVYTICGLAYLVDDLSLFQIETSLSGLTQLLDDNVICGDLTDRCMTLNISEVDNIIDIDTTLCVGDTLSFLGVKIFDDIDTNILRTNQVTCDSLISITATVINLMADIDAPDTVTTCGSSVFLNASSSMSNGSDIEYIWTTDIGSYENDIGPIAEVNEAGLYTLEILSDNCRDTTDILITSIDTFELDYDITGGTCVGDTFMVTLSSASDINSYIVDSPDVLDLDEDNFTTIVTGQYFIDVTSGTCMIRDSVLLENQATLIDVQVSSSEIDCDSTFSRTIVTTNASNASYTYDGPSVINDDSDMIQISMQGIYTVTVTDGLGCTASSSFIVEGSADLPQIIVDDVISTCNNPITELSLIINSPFDSLRWIGPLGFTSDDQNPSVTESGNYTITVYGPNGCNTTSTISYSSENIPPIFNIEGDTLSCNNPIANICVEETDLAVQWTFDNQALSSERCIQTSDPGQYIINVIDMNGCTGSGTYDLIDITSFPDVMVSMDTIIQSCDGNPNNLEAINNSGSSDLSYAWIYDNAEIANDSIASIIDTGVYILITIDTLNGCTISDTTHVLSPFSELLQNDISISYDSISCNQDSSQLFINGIELEALDVYINQELISVDSIVLAEGEYEMLLVDSLMCERTFSFSVERSEDWLLDIGPDITAASGSMVEIISSITLPISEIIDISWSDTTNLSCSNCLNPTITVDSDQLLSLQITDSNGCVKSDTLRISIDNNSNIYFPNVFSTSLEGENSEWAVYLPDANVIDFELRIYDRWGNLVTFQTETGNNRKIVWDGTYNEKIAEIGLYVYVAKYFDNTNREYLTQGQIMLIR